MKILVTGASGFLGTNLIQKLKRDSSLKILKFNRNDSFHVLEDHINNADFIFHLAGTNKGSEEDLFSGNEKLTQKICNIYNNLQKEVPIIFSSTRHADSDSLYGKSKLNTEKILKKLIPNINLRIYRLSNLFGKWCKPNYNSVVSTFCYKIARDIDVEINNPSHEIPLVHVDDVTDEFKKQIYLKSKEYLETEIKPLGLISVKDLANTIFEFKNMRSNLEFLNLGEGLRKKLYSTYLTYLPTSQFSYPIKKHSDARGIFSEFMRLGNSGQISFFTAKPGVTRGKHSHDTKTEKFLVVSGTARFNHECCSTKEYYSEVINEKDFLVVDTIPGWVHEIQNIGKDDLIIIAWANECFDENKPDTYGVN